MTFRTDLSAIAVLALGSVLVRCSSGATGTGDAGVDAVVSTDSAGRLDAPTASDMGMHVVDGAADAEVTDAGTSDVGVADAEVTDATAPDGDVADTGLSDASNPDADAGCAHTICGTDCTDVQTDVHHCGNCSNDCTTLPFVDAASTTCSAGACVLACAAGYTHCGSDPTTGCETNTQTDLANCGGCRAPCNEPNATASCAGGMCSIAMCNSGFFNCDGVQSNGCEIDLQNDPNNCNGCGVLCPVANDIPACSGGMCTVAACIPGFADCDGNPANGCERPTESDPNNCGDCRVVCTLPGAVAGCAGGMCTVASCNSGFVDCDHVASNGCEVNIESDPSNCGNCTQQCFVASGTAGCAAGHCTVASCDSGFGNCDGNVGNGCEASLTQIANCGMCGNNCTTACAGGVASTACSTAGSCEVASCATGQLDLDGVCSNGCECTVQPSASCFTATVVPSLTPGNSANFTRNLVPTGSVTYYVVVYTSPTGHPSIALTSNPGGEFTMTIYSDCAQDVVPTLPATGTGTFYVAVSRAAGHPTTCSNFTLRFAD